jgi:SAM-dependent methyltransferase
MNPGMLGRLRRKARRFVGRAGLARQQKSGVEYWQERVRALGEHSVLNVGHLGSRVDEVTAFQQTELFPYFTACLEGWERTVLDFGCGPGRFTPDLARLVNGEAVGVDPIERLLELAPRTASVRYEVMEEGFVPLPDDSFDVIWVCLVLGGIKDPFLQRTLAELNRLLRFNGLLFLVENTTAKEVPADAAWLYRSLEEYRDQLRFAPLEHLGDYYDLGERISIMAGRKATNADRPPDIPRSDRELAE